MTDVRVTAVLSPGRGAGKPAAEVLEMPSVLVWVVFEMDAYTGMNIGDLCNFTPQ